MVKRQKADVFRGRRRIEVGKLGGGTLILPRRVYGVKRSMLCGVQRVTQDVQFYKKANGRCVPRKKKDRGWKAGGGSTLILPKRVYGVKRSMLCGVPRVTQDVQFYKMNSFCLKKGHGLKALLVHSHPNSPRRSKSLQSKFMSKEVLVN